jgi:lysine-specific demethylase 8
MPSVETFMDEHVADRAPVVITDLFAGHEASAIRTIGDAVAAWGDVPLQVQDEYARAGAAPPSTMTLADYVEHTRREPGSARCCTEYPTPARILATFRLPEVCRVERDPGTELLDLPRRYGPRDLVTNLFVANRGNVAHLHFDGDQREVLLHQVYGRKRVLLFPPESAPRLRTLDGPRHRPSLAGLELEHMSLDEQLALVDECGGWHTVLEPGETIYLPMLVWHHLTYLDDGMSWNLRFARTRYGRFLCLDNFHRDPLLQNVAATFSGVGAALDAHLPAAQELVDAYVAPADDVAVKVAIVRRAARDLCRRRVPALDTEALCPMYREDEQISRIVESRDMEGGMKYADPATIRRTRPVGAVTDRQRQLLEETMGARGWPREVVPRIVDNLVSQENLDALTKAEAAQVLEYLRSPGSAW